MNRIATALLCGCALPALLIQAAHANPVGGTVAQGAAAITSNGKTLTVDQKTKIVIVNWNSFNIGTGETTRFNQPGSNATAVNRIGGGDPAQILGNLSANGRVILIDSNGILFGPNARVNAASLIATTADAADADLMRGKADFNKPGKPNARIVNQGHITAVEGGMVGLIAPSVFNKGTVRARLGQVNLAGANVFTLDFTGDGLISFSADPGVVAAALDANGRPVKALVVNNGEIEGAIVTLTARAAAGLVENAISMTGKVVATAAHEVGGKIVLDAGQGSIALAGATLDASGAKGGGGIAVGDWDTASVSADAATSIKANAVNNGNGGTVDVIARTTAYHGAILAKGGRNSGDGGQIETSGHRLDVSGITVDTAAPQGTTGNWTLDPYNVTVSNGAASNESGFAATGDDSVINATDLENALSASSVTVTTGGGGSQAGDITVAAPLAWSDNTLTLDAYHSIVFNASAVISGSGGLALKTNDGGTGGDYSFNGAHVDYGTSDQGGTLNINGQDYTLLYTIGDIDNIDTTGLNKDYALAANLDVSGSTYTKALVADGGSAFTGVFTGLGHTIDSLTIISSNPEIGLFGFANGGTVRDIGLRGGAVSGASFVGELIGESTGATVRNAYATGTVSGSNYVGGLIGQAASTTVSNAYATGAVSGNSVVGGLIGLGNNAAVSNAYATGVVTGGGGGNAGGLIGQGNGATVSNVYATGAVSSSGSSSTVGGLIGSGTPTSVSNAYFDIETTGQTGGSGTGLTTAQIQSGALTFDTADFFTQDAGLYPYLKSFHPDGVQAITGTVYDTDDSTALTAASVALYQQGAVLGTVSSGANGYYYLLLDAGMVDGTKALGGALTAPGATGAGGLAYRETAGTGNGFDLTLGLRTLDTSATRSSAFIAGLASTFGASYTALDSDLAAAGASARIDAAGGFTIDSDISDLVSNADLAVKTDTGDLTVSAALDWASGKTLTLDAWHDLLVEADITVSGAGTLVLFANGNSTDGDYRFNGAHIDYGTSDQGGKLSINGHNYALLYTMADIDAIDATGLGGDYALATDLDASGTTYTAAPVGGDYSHAFTGAFTGLGHTISNLTIDTGGNDFAGLFGSVDTGAVRDIGLVGGSVAGGYYTGGLIGYGDHASVSNAFATGAVSGGDYVGGLIGYDADATISSVYATGAVSDRGSSAGGLIGSGSRLAVSNAYATGDVSGDGAVGGLIGYGLDAIVSDAHASGSVSGSSNSVGGLIGQGEEAQVSNAYATGTVIGGDYVGGLVGYGARATINGAHATGAVSGSDGVGGLIGWSDGATVSNAYATGAVLGSDDDAGGLVGSGYGATISNAYAIGDVSGKNAVGGLVGYGDHAVASDVHATGKVSGSGNDVGGLIGYGIYATVSDAFATGAVSGGGNSVGGLIGTAAFGGVNDAYATGAVSGSGNDVGGLIGGGQQASFRDAYATGMVSGGDNVGGLIGYGDQASFSDVYATGRVSGSNKVGGLIGSGVSASVTDVYFDIGTTGQIRGIGTDPSSVSMGMLTADLQGALPGGYDPAIWGTGGGLYPYLSHFYAATPQAITGFAMNADGSAAAGATVASYQGGALLGTASAGANGYYYDLVPSGTFASGNIALGTTVTALGASVAGGLSFSDSVQLSNNTIAQDVILGMLNANTRGTTFSALAGDLAATFGVSNYAALSSMLDGAALNVTAAGDFTLDQALSRGGAIAVSAGDITVAAPVTSQAGGDAISLAASGSFINNQGSGALSTPNGRWLVYSAGVVGDTFGGLDSANLAVWNTAAGGAVSASGNRYVFADKELFTVTTVSDSKTYGDTADISGDYTIAAPATSGVFLYDDPAVLVTGAPSIASTGAGVSASVAASPYTITASLGTLSAPSYAEFAFDNAGELTVTARPITVTYTADAASNVYGGTPSNLSGSYALTSGNLVNGDSLGGTVGFTTTADATSGVGSYGITGSGLIANGNYNLTSAQANSNAGALSITARPITVTYTADVAQSVYGDTPSGLTGSYALTSGSLVNGDSLAGTAIFTTTAGETSNVGFYDITGSGITASANYSLTSTQAAGNATALSITALPPKTNEIANAPGYWAALRAAFEESRTTLPDLEPLLNLLSGFDEELACLMFGCRPAQSAQIMLHADSDRQMAER